jgi:DNA-binding NtrC family response regulator
MSMSSLIEGPVYAGRCRRALLAESSQHGSGLATTTDSEDTADTPPGVHLDWCLAVAYHEQPGLIGLRKVLPSGTSLVLGRGASCMGAGVFDQTSISRHHTRITALDDDLVVEDLGSRNGTSLNGLKSAMTKLSSSGVIGIGPTLLVAYRTPAEYRVPDQPSLAGKSYALSCVLDDIEKVAPYPTNVLIIGESGSGKELVAREIHAASKRSGRLCAVNCGALGGDILQSEIFGHARGAFTGADRDRIGLLEAAHRGTLFLDEIGEASAELQVSLLRFLEDGEVRPLGRTTSRLTDVRIVAASHRDLTSMIKNGMFREDLYARLSGWQIRVPPLRERVEDIPHLAAHFVHKLTGRHQPIHPRLILALLVHPWPRNVRELRTVLERAVIESCGQASIALSPSLEAMLPSTPSAVARASTGVDPEPDAASWAEQKRALVQKPTQDQLITMIVKQRGNVRSIAANLDISRNTLYRWFHEYSIKIDKYRPAGG